MKLLGSGFLLTALAPFLSLCPAKSSKSDAANELPASGAQQDIRAPESFDTIADATERSRALFLESSRVFSHPRCKNCHPAGDSPLQGDSSVIHDPPVTRGPHDDGIPALACSSCHQETNLELARVPGAPKWRLAPSSMAWSGRSPSEICAQIKDVARNGGRSLAELVEHSGHDPLVAWGWAPGHGRTPAPGSQARFGALIAAWVETGAACPLEERAP
jgi:hypothetical protein